MSIGENIRNLRKQNDLTQKRLGELCEPPISESTIRKYELGLLNPKIQTIAKIAKALNVSSNQIVYGFNSNISYNNLNLYYPLEIDPDDSCTYISKEQLIGFGNNIKKYRQLKHISLKQLSISTSIPCDELKQYESGTLEPNIFTVSKIAKVFDINNLTLLGDYALLLALSFRQNLGDDIGGHFVDGINVIDEHLLLLYHSLNNEGQKVAIERIQELLFIPKYQKDQRGR